MGSDLFVEVADADGAPLPGAQGSVTSKAIQGQRTAISDATGRMRFADLPPGDYDLIVAMDGFSPVRDDDIPVRRDEPRSIRITLQLADIG